MHFVYGLKNVNNVVPNERALNVCVLVAVIVTKPQSLQPYT